MPCLSLCRDSLRGDEAWSCQPHRAWWRLQVHEQQSKRQKSNIFHQRRNLPTRTMSKASRRGNLLEWLLSWKPCQCGCNIILFRAHHCVIADAWCLNSGYGQKNLLGEPTSNCVSNVEGDEGSSLDLTAGVACGEKMVAWYCLASTCTAIAARPRNWTWLIKFYVDHTSYERTLRSAAPNANYVNLQVPL